MLDRPIIAHVHVPKTAGSSVNAALRSHLGQGYDHVQRFASDPAKFAAIAHESRWLAGHIPTPEFRALLKKADVQAAFITAVRQPSKQIASHYNWLIEIGHRGREFLAGHPEAIRNIHLEISRTDNSDPAAVLGNLEKYPNLFLNCQAKHVIGRDQYLTHDTYTDLLRDFDAVVFSDNLEESLASILGHQSAPVGARENASRYHFDPTIFDHPDIRIFLQERNQADEKLWNAAKSLHRESLESAIETRKG